MIKVKWDIEEAVAIVDVYFKYQRGEIKDLGKSLERLSQTLIKRADILNIKHDDKFRNLNGMKSILANVEYIDSDGSVGLSNASKIIRTAVELYKNDRDQFDNFLIRFQEKYEKH